MKDLVVIVLLNYNQNDYTLKCIDSLLELNYDNFRIMLIDNGSTQVNANELEEKLPKNEKLFYRRVEENIGYSQGTNYGLKEGKKMNPGYFLIMNNDTIIDKNAVNELVKTSKEYKDKVLVTGKVYHYDEPDKLQFVGYRYINKRIMTFQHLGLDESDTGQYDRTEERDMIDDIFVLHPISLYDTLGGYTPYLWVNGVNIDLAMRAMNKGYKLIFTPLAKLWHKGSVSIGGRDMNPRMAYWNIQSSLILRYLYLNKSNFIIYYLMTIVSIIRTSFKSVYLKLFKGKDITNYAKAKYKGLSYFNKWVFSKKHDNGFNPY